MRYFVLVSSIFWFISCVDDAEPLVKPLPKQEASAPPPEVKTQMTTISKIPTLDIVPTTSSIPGVDINLEGAETVFEFTICGAKGICSPTALKPGIFVAGSAMKFSKLPTKGGMLTIRQCVRELETKSKVCTDPRQIPLPPTETPEGKKQLQALLHEHFQVNQQAYEECQQLLTRFAEYVEANPQTRLADALADVKKQGTIGTCELVTSNEFSEVGEATAAYSEESEGFSKKQVFFFLITAGVLGKYALKMHKKSQDLDAQKAQVEVMETEQKQRAEQLKSLFADDKGGLDRKAMEDAYQVNQEKLDTAKADLEQKTKEVDELSDLFEKVKSGEIPARYDALPKGIQDDLLSDEVANEKMTKNLGDIEAVLLKEQALKDMNVEEWDVDKFNQQSTDLKTKVEAYADKKLEIPKTVEARTKISEHELKVEPITVDGKTYYVGVDYIDPESGQLAANNSERPRDFLVLNEDGFPLRRGPGSDEILLEFGKKDSDLAKHYQKTVELEAAKKIVKDHPITRYVGGFDVETVPFRVSDGALQFHDGKAVNHAGLISDFKGEYPDTAKRVADEISTARAVFSTQLRQNLIEVRGKDILADIKSAEGLMGSVDRFKAVEIDVANTKALSSKGVNAAKIGLGAAAAAAVLGGLLTVTGQVDGLLLQGDDSAEAEQLPQDLIEKVNTVRRSSKRMRELQQSIELEHIQSVTDDIENPPSLPPQ